MKTVASLLCCLGFIIGAGLILNGCNGETSNVMQQIYFELQAIAGLATCGMSSIIFAILACESTANIRSIKKLEEEASRDRKQIAALMERGRIDASQWSERADTILQAIEKNTRAAKH